MTGSPVSARKLLDCLHSAELDSVCGAGAEDDRCDTAPEGTQTLGRRDTRDGVGHPTVDRCGGRREHLHPRLRGSSAFVQGHYPPLLPLLTHFY
jgi:hypothetical protein